MQVGLRVQGNFGGGNVFEVQLSDGGGNFGSPVTVGTLARSGAINDELLEITVNFPDIDYLGVNYQLRAVSTAPSAISALRSARFIAFRATQGRPERCEAANGIANLEWFTGGSEAWIRFGNRPEESAAGTSRTYDNLSTGVYTATFRTASGCTLTRQAIIARESSIDLLAPVPSRPSSCTSEDGFINFTLTYPNSVELRIERLDGSEVFPYSSPIRTANVDVNGDPYKAFTFPDDFAGPPRGLASGTYRVYLRDNLGCVEVRTVTIANLGGASIDDITAIRRPRCGNENTGILRVEATGTGAVRLFMNGQLIASGTSLIVQDVNNLPAGRYIFRVVDADDCTDEWPFDLLPIEPDFEINIEERSPACGQGNGRILAWVDAAGTYSYSINGGPPQAQGVFEGLTGSVDYVITVRDEATGCERETTVNLEPGTSITLALDELRAPTCVDPTGSYVLSVSNAAEPVRYFVNGDENLSCSGLACIFDGLAAGRSYTFRAVDATGCPAETTITLNLTGQPELANWLVRNPSCNGANDGFISFTVSGASPISIELDGPDGVFSPPPVNSPHFFSLDRQKPGTYTFRILDANACPVETTLVLIEPEPITFTWEAGNTTCMDRFGGYITITPTSGHGNLMYTLAALPPAGGQAAPFFSNLPAGTYRVTAYLADNPNCAVSQDVVISEINYLQELLDSPNLIQTFRSCFNEPTGRLLIGIPRALVNLNGIEFSLNNGPWRSDTVFAPLAAGAYNLRARDRDGCEATLNNIIVLATPAINVNVIVNHPNCSETTGTIIVAAAGGDGPLYYSASTNADPDLGSYQLSGELSGLIPGNSYYVFVRDANGCTVAAPGNPYLINPSQNLNLAVIGFQNPSCPGANDGFVLVRASGGAAPYRFSRDNTNFTAPQNEQEYRFTGLAAGRYDVYVKDANDCEGQADNVRLVDPGPLQVIVIGAETHGPNCQGDKGVITINGQGGNPPNLPPYEYSIDGVNWGPVNRFENLDAGSYTVYVRMTNVPGCSPASEQVELAPAPLLTMEAPEVVRYPCPIEARNPGNGALRLRVSGGDPNNPPVITLFSRQLGMPVGNDAGFDVLYQGLRGGTFDIYVNDDVNNCYDDLEGYELIPSPPVSATATPNPASCQGGNDASIDVAANGGTPDLFYSIDGANYGSEPRFGGLGDNVGPFYLLIRDNSQNNPLYNQCEYRFPDPIYIPAAAPAPNLNPLGSAETRCNVFRITATATGGQGAITYVLRLGAVEIERNQSGVFDELAAGGYTVVAVDTRGCESPELTINLQASNVDIQANAGLTPPKCGTRGEIEVRPTPPDDYEYRLNNGAWQSENIFADLDAGNYIVQVRQVNPPYCQAQQSVDLSDADVQRIGYDPPVIAAACPGLDNGNISINASTTNGVLSVTIQPGGREFIAPPDVAPFVFSNLAPGDYTIELMDGADCPPMQVPVTVGARPQPTLDIEAFSPVCPAGTTGDPALFEGRFSLTASGGQSPYEFSINGGAWQVQSQFTRDENGDPLQADVVYGFKVKDAAGCESASWPSQFAPAPPVDITAGPDPFAPPCNLPGVGGRIVVTAQGAGTLRYLLLDELNAERFNQLEDGTFLDVQPGKWYLRLVDVRAAGACTLTHAREIEVPVGRELAVDSTSTAPTCGEDNGSIELTRIEGFDDPRILFDGAETALTRYDNLGEGRYIVRVEERGEPRCFWEAEFVLRAEGGMDEITITEKIKPCFGDGQTNGTLEYFTQGGTNVVYMLTNTETSEVFGPNATGRFENLPAGPYRVDAINEEGCTKALPDTLESLPELTLTPVSEGPTCVDPTIRLRIEAAGGTGAGYRYSLDGGPDAPLPTDFLSETFTAESRYSFVVRDDRGCAGALNWTAPSAAVGITATEAQRQNPTCWNSADGWIRLDILGGTAPYRYALDGSAPVDLPANNQISGLAGGREYRIVIIDAATPPCVSDTVRVTLTAPDTVRIAVADLSKPACYDSTNGAFTLSVSGGAPPYTLEVFKDDAPFDQVPNLDADTPEAYAGLGVGLYLAKATDSNNCPDEEEIDLMVSPVDAGQDLEICAAYWKTGDSRTFDLAAYGSPAGGQWSGEGVSANVLTYTDALLGRPLALTYSVNGCEDQMALTVKALWLEATAEACAEDTITLAAQPANGVWTSEDGSLSASSIQGDQLSLAGVAPGDYRLRFAADGCEAVQTLTVNPLPKADFSILTEERKRIVNEPISFRAETTATGWTHAWTFGPQGGGSATGAEPNQTFAEAGEYTATHEATNEFGCKAETVQPFEVLPLPQLQLPTFFSPNSDGFYDFFPTIGGTDGLNPDALLSLRVFDRAGQRVWEWKRGESGWDGTVNGANAIAGVYFWQAEFKPLDAPRIIVRTGQVTLIR